MRILFIHEIDWRRKVVFEMHSLSELLSLMGHQVYAIDHEDAWKRRHHLDLGTLGTTEYPATCRAMTGAQVHLRRPGFIKMAAASRLSAAATHYFEIGRTLRREQIDVLVLYSVATNAVQAIHLAHRMKIPVVFRSIDIVNQLVPYRILRPPTRLLEKWVYRRADLVLALTPGLARYVKEMGAHEDRVEVLLPGVDTAMFAPRPPRPELRHRWGISDQDEVILFVGTLFDFSGLDSFICHFPTLLRAWPHAKLLIVGDGPQRPLLERAIAEAGLDGRVVITGFQPYSDVPDYINMAAVCINPFAATDATRDIIPTKLLQYLACGKAVVCTRLAGSVAVLAGEAQGVIYASDPAAMLQEMATLLESRERRRRLEENGLRYVTANHSYSRIGTMLETILDRMSKGRAS